MIPAVLAASVPAGAEDLDVAVRESYATNEGMLTQATTSAVAKLFLGMNLPLGSSLRVEPASDHPANWFVEAHLLAYLSQAGYQAYLTKSEATAAPGGTAVPATDAGMDTLAAPDSVSLGKEAEPPAEGRGIPEYEPDYVLRYRTVLCELSYPEKFKTSPFGSSKVQRRASVSLVAQVLEGEREDVVWVGKGSVERVNVVPAGKLSMLAGTNFPFNPPALESRSMSSYVEPVLVTGIVAGLIYLFYANQD